MLPSPLEILAVIFLAVVIATFLLLRWIWQPRSRMEDRLAREDADYLPGADVESRVGSFNMIMSSLIPITGEARLNLYKDLRNAGHYRPTAFVEYLARRNSIVLLCLLAGGGLVAVVAAEWIPYVALGTCAAAMLAFTFPRMVINAQARKRMQQIERGMPVVIDLVNLGLSSGLNIPAALERVGKEVRHSYPVWSDELRIVHQQAQLRSIEYSLGEFADRVPVPEARQFAQLLAQSERLGTDATFILTETADNLRVTMRQRAETQANRASFWMLLPTISCFMVATALILLSPLFLEMRNKASDFRKIMMEGTEKLNQVNGPNK